LQNCDYIVGAVITFDDEYLSAGARFVLGASE
jgi:hypothetical protein